MPPRIIKGESRAQNPSLVALPTRCSRSFQNWIMGILSPPGPSSGLWTSVPVRLQMMMFTIRNTRPIITPGMIPALKRSGTEVLVEAP